MSKQNNSVKIVCPGCQKLIGARGISAHIGSKHPEIYEIYFKLRVDNPSWTAKMTADYLNGYLYAQDVVKTDREGNVVWEAPEPDPVNHPSHYTFGKFEVLDVLQDWFPKDPLLWQVVKYIARANHKGNRLQDLEKARFYLNEEIEKEKENNTSGK